MGLKLGTGEDTYSISTQGNNLSAIHDLYFDLRDNGINVPYDAFTNALIKENNAHGVQLTQNDLSLPPTHFINREYAVKYSEIYFPTEIAGKAITPEIMAKLAKDHFSYTAISCGHPEPQVAEEPSVLTRSLEIIGGGIAAVIGTRSAQAALPETIVQAVPAVLPKLDTTPVRLASQDFGASNLDTARKLAAQYAQPQHVAAATEPAPEAAEPTELDLLIEKLEKPQPMLARSKHPKEENKPLQQALAMLGELKVGKDGKPDDGYFGKATEAAVRRIQAEAQKDDPSIAVDGIVGKDTWRIILEKLKEKQAEQQPAIAGLGHFDSPSVPPMAQNEKATSRQA